MPYVIWRKLNATLTNDQYMKANAEIIDDVDEKRMVSLDPVGEPSRPRAAGCRAKVLRYLLFLLTARNIKTKCKQSVMGLVWAIFMPAIIVGAGMLIRVATSKMRGAPPAPDSLASITLEALP